MPPEERPPAPAEHRNLIHLQRAAAVKKLDVQIAEDWASGYAVEVDQMLERRHRLVEEDGRPIA